jgi:hypothetical protein
VGTVVTVHAHRGDLAILGVPSTLDIAGGMKLFWRLSKVKQAQSGSSNLMFAIVLLCSKRDRSVVCAAAGDRAVVIILFLQIETDDRIGIICN